MSAIPLSSNSRPLNLPRFGGRIPRPSIGLTSALLLLAALAVAALMLLPPLYLVVRTAESGQAAVDLLLKTSTLTALWQTILLAASVTVASAVLAVPMAWLTICSDLPGRRLWFVAAALPLVLPSYIVAYL